jgi:uncharacterized membrane protein
MNLLRLSAVWEQMRGSLWLLPAVSVAVSAAVGTLLATYPPLEETVLAPVLFGGTASGARSVLSLVASSMITVTALTFTLTVVALQMASAQYSPRVLRGFLVDRGNQTVLAIFLGTFAYCISVLRLIREETADVQAVVPQAAVTLGGVLTFLSVGALVYFIDHLTKQLRIEKLLDEIEHDTLEAVRSTENGGAGRRTIERLPTPPEGARRVTARRTGYLQTVRTEALAREAERHGVVVRLRPTLGARVTKGTTIGWVWPVDPDETDLNDDDLADLVHHEIHIGFERTGRRDVAFGLRQLVDIAERALSPGVNDPTTAVNVIGSLSPVLCALTSVDSGSQVVDDEEGRMRLIVPRPTFVDYLELCCGEIRRYGKGEPAVQKAMLGMLTDVAECAETDRLRRAVEVEINRIEEAADRELQGEDRRTLDRALAIARRTVQDGERPPEPDVEAS